MRVFPMYDDPVVAEIHETRRRLLEASGGDVAEFRRQLREREKVSGRDVVAGTVRNRAVQPRASSGHDNARAG